MRASKLSSIVRNVDHNIYEHFLENSESNLLFDRNYQGVDYDDSWIDKFEEAYPAIDEVIRNPKRFIVKEEEVVRIEKARKITQDSIKHLSQHTSFIQKIDENGFITPNKILNVRKEESIDIYENRFIYSLVRKMLEFIELRKKTMGEGTFSKIERKITYNGKTEFGDDTVDFKFSMQADKEDKSKSSKSTYQRIADIEMKLSDFMGSSFIKGLKGATIVRSPIRKTNAILKNQNFKKGLELWEFLESYDITEKKVIDKKQKLKNPIILKENLDDLFMLMYTVIDKNDGKGMNPKVSRYYIHQLISNFLKTNRMYEEDEFKKVVFQEFDNIRKEAIHKDKMAKNAINKLFTKYETEKRNLIKTFDLL